MSLTQYPKYYKTDTVWLNSIPYNWKMLKTKYLFKERSKKGFQNEPMLAATQSHGVVPKTMYENRTVIAQKDLHLLKLVEPGDFVISLRSFQGGIEKAHYRGIISPAYTILTPFILISGEYFKYLAKSKPFIKLLTTCVTGIREGQNIDYEVLKRSKLPVPMLQDQNQIARYLDWKVSQINKFIKAKKGQIELLKEQKQVIINDAVTGKIDVRTGKPYPNYKDTGLDWLKKIPESWEFKRLRTFANVRASGVDKNSAPDEIIVKLCNYVDVYKNDQISKVINFMVATATPEEIKSFRVRAGDVIVTKDSESWKDIAVPAYVSEELSDVICAYHLSLIRVDVQIAIGEFIYYGFSSDQLSYQFRISANGVTRYGLSQGAIKNGIFPIPSLSEQTEICKYLSLTTINIETLIQKSTVAISLIQEYRTRLIADVVTGKIDVRNIIIPDLKEEDVLIELQAHADIEEILDDATIDIDL